MNADQVKKLVDYVLNYGLKFIDVRTRTLVIDQIDLFLPDVIANLIGDSNPTAIVTNALNAIGLMLAPFPLVATVFNFIVKPLILKNLPKVLVAFESSSPMLSEGETLSFFQQVD
jgi:hypothetical protein